VGKASRLRRLPPEAVGLDRSAVLAESEVLVRNHDAFKVSNHDAFKVGEHDAFEVSNHDAFKVGNHNAAKSV